MSTLEQLNAENTIIDLCSEWFNYDDPSVGIHKVNEFTQVEVEGVNEDVDGVEVHSWSKDFVEFKVNGQHHVNIKRTNDCGWMVTNRSE